MKRMTQSARTTTANLPIWKKILFSLIIAVGFPVAGILAIEGAGYAIIHFMYGVPGKSYGLWTYDAEIGAIHASNGYNSNSETNNYGFRNKEDVLDPKPPGSIRVIAYGGSTTFCYNLETDQAWPLRLQEELRKYAGPKSQVLNAGAITWSIGQEMARAKRDLPRLKPDVVILYSGLNEETNANHLKLEGISLEKAVAEGKYGIFTTNLDQSRWLKRNSLIVRFLEYTNLFGPAPNYRPARDYPIGPEVRDNFNRTLREFIALIRQNSIMNPTENCLHEFQHPHHLQRKPILLVKKAVFATVIADCQSRQRYGLRSNKCPAAAAIGVDGMAGRIRKAHLRVGREIICQIFAKDRAEFGGGHLRSLLLSS